MHSEISFMSAYIKNENVNYDSWPNNSKVDLSELKKDCYPEIKWLINVGISHWPHWTADVFPILVQ